MAETEERAATDVSALKDELFKELRRLNDPGLSGDELDAEIRRAKAVSSVSGVIIDSYDTIIKVYEVQAEHGPATGNSLPRMLES